MFMRRGAIALGLAAAMTLALSANLSAQTDRKMSDAEKREIEAIYELIDGVIAGKPAPNELMLEWARHDLLKALGDKQYVPFIVTIDPSTTSAKELRVYWRVVPKVPAGEPAAAPTADAKADAAPVQFAYEDMNSVTLPSGREGKARISRSFTVGDGAYDVFIVVKEPAPARAQRNAPPQKISLLRQSVDVPELWNEELTTSSVFIAERIDPLPAPLTPEQQAERPYAMGPIEIVPVIDTRMPKSTELSTFFMIYNAKSDAANKPDVSVEFNFYTTPAGEAEKFFNKTSPQELNAQTLPPQFDFAAGHQLQSGQSVPLGSFPEGEYRLEIKVTDKLANTSVTRNVNFTVVGS
jgi:hypothetical protein